MGIEELRRGYRRAELRKRDLEPDPLVQFGKWMREAVGADLLEPTAMTLATADLSGRVSARMVLLKGYGPDGFLFYSNYTSRKAQDLAANPQAALVLYWDRLERQVRVEGVVEKISREASEAYFRSRPRGSQIGAWASPQSKPLSGRAELLEREAQARQRFEGREVPLPDHWGGFRLRPLALELWQGRPDRLHDRFRYSREEEGWRLERLAP
ncbi:MAG TPA: pyridoxamine 5'-phosphate oxidase [Trueperaceae bacterium]